MGELSVVHPSGHTSSSRSDILIAGIGTLGSPLLELAVRQALAGLWPIGDPQGKLIAIDPDYVERHNISKSAIYSDADVGARKADAAAAWADGVDPTNLVIPVPDKVQDVGYGPFRNAGVVLLAVDNFAAKICAFRRAFSSGVPLIMIGELAGESSVNSRFRYYFPGEGQPCIECTYEGAVYAHLDTRYSCSSAPATGAGGNGRQRGPVTRLSAAYRLASSMLEECERITSALRSPGQGVPVDGSDLRRAAEIRLLPLQRQTLTLWPKRNPDCCFDHQLHVIEPLADELDPLAAEQLTLGDAAALAARRIGSQPDLLLEQRVATAWRCHQDHYWTRVRRLALGADRCPVCGAPGMPEDATRYLSADDLDRLARHPLVGPVVPPGDVLAFLCDGATIRLALPQAQQYHRNGSSRIGNPVAVAESANQA
jgi:molybdopterin/thiamine biosynthesis adenylyltransferase